MKILLLTALVALASADVSHLLNQQQTFGYQYQNPAPQNIPQSSYGVPQSSVLGNGGHSVSYSSLGSASVPQLSLPSISGPSVGFNSGFSSPSGVSIQSYNGFSNPGSSAGLSGFQVSTQAPSVDLSSFQGSTPSSSIDFSNFQVSSPAPPSADLSSFQVSSPSPSVDLSGFQASTPSSIPSVNLVQYSQPSSSYQFLSKLSQPSANVPTLGFSSVNGAQFGSDASFNAGVGSGSSGSFGSNSQIGSGFGSGQSYVGKTSGGSIGDSFGVVTDAAGHAGDSQQSDVSKHLYFFDAPEEEEEEVHAKINLPAVPAKKTYKIIFIKAPTYRNQASITIPAPPQNEEKTLVYVLVKKPEGQPKVRFQDAAPTVPSKPEVFFIKYKTQKEAEAAVAEIQSKHGAAGQVIANLPAGAQVPSSINLGDIGSVSQGGLEGDVSLSSGNIGGISVSSTTPSVNFDGSSFGSVGQSGFVSGASASSGSGFSVDSLGANSFVSSTPASANFESRISEQVNVPAQGGAGEANLQFTLAQGGLSQSPTPVTFGQNSADSSQIIGSSIASSPSAPDASSSSAAGSSGGVVFEANSSLDAQVQQQESNEGDSSSSSVSSSEEASLVNVHEASPSAEGSDDSNVAHNVIEQRADVPSADNQGSQAAGFATYGAPNY